MSRKQCQYCPRTTGVFEKADGRKICKRCDSRPRRRDSSKEIRCIDCKFFRPKHTHDPEKNGWRCNWCASKHKQQVCCRCQKKRPVAKAGEQGPLCAPCYRFLLPVRTCGVCSALGQHRYRTADRKPKCSRCYKKQRRLGRAH